MQVAHNGKNRALYTWLGRQEKDTVRLTFTEVENILGFPLPPSSRDHLAHWYSYGGSAVGRAIRDAGWRASHVNLTAETVTLSRGGRSQSLVESLEVRNIDTRIIELLLRLAHDRSVEACTENTHLLPLSAAHDGYAAVYVAPRDVSIALDADMAQRVHLEQGFRLETKTATTSYIHVTADQLGDSSIALSALHLLAVAFDRAERGPRWTRGLPDRRLSRGELCPRCSQEKSVSGVCSNCD